MIILNEMNIKSFRGFKDIKLNDLKDINMFVGENNTGKTTLLEVIRMIENPAEIGSVIRIALEREKSVKSFMGGRLTPYHAMMTLFNKNDKEKVISLSYDLFNKKNNIDISGQEESVLKVQDKKHEYQYKISDYENMQEDVTSEEEVLCFNGYYAYNYDNKQEKKKILVEEDLDRIGLGIRKFHTVDVEYLSNSDYYTQNNLKILGNAIKHGYKENIIDMLQIFDKDILGYELINENDSAVPYLNHSKLGYMPLSSFGDGVKKALVIAARLVRLQKGILLIDEIETGIHVDALKTFIVWLTNICTSQNVQLFFTTHSIEAIDAILEASKNNIDKVACYRLEKGSEKVEIKRFSGKKLYNIRNNMGLDVR